MQIWKLCGKKWRQNDVITKNDKKMHTEKPVKLYIIRNVLMRAIQKCKFNRIRVILSTVVGI